MLQFHGAVLIQLVCLILYRELKIARMVAVASRTPHLIQQSGRGGAGRSPCGLSIPGREAKDMERETWYRLQLVGCLVCRNVTWAKPGDQNKNKKHPRVGIR